MDDDELYKELNGLFETYDEMHMLETLYADLIHSLICNKKMRVEDFLNMYIGTDD